MNYLERIATRAFQIGYDSTGDCENASHSGIVAEINGMYPSWDAVPRSEYEKRGLLKIFNNVSVAAGAAETGTSSISDDHATLVAFLDCLDHSRVTWAVSPPKDLRAMLNALISAPSHQKAIELMTEVYRLATENVAFKPISVPDVSTMLAELQWQYQPETLNHTGGYYCPECGNTKALGHLSTCRVKLALEASEKNQ